MQRINKRAGFLIKFIDGTYEIAKSYNITSSSIRMVLVTQMSDSGKEQNVPTPEMMNHQGDYLDYVCSGDSGSISPMKSIIRVKSIKYKPLQDKIIVYTLDNKELLIISLGTT